MSTYFVKGKGVEVRLYPKGNQVHGSLVQNKKSGKTGGGRKTKGGEKSQATDRDANRHGLFGLVNLRLDHVKAYNSESHYRDVFYHARRWIKRWNGLLCCDLTPEVIEKYMIARSKTSPYVANKELQYLRALFNFGIKRKLLHGNPTDGISFMPVKKRKKYIPPRGDVVKVIDAADLDTQQYLLTILLTAGRVNEINKLKWDDISFKNNCITLWTRKRKGGNEEAREIHMSPVLNDILSYRLTKNDGNVPWVFWHRFWSRKIGRWKIGPYKDRNKIMRTLCKKAKVRYFRFHALRHLAASMLDNKGVDIGDTQRILGHQNRQTTEIYLHSVGESERIAMSKLGSDEMFTNSSTTLYKGPTNMGANFWNRKVERPPIEVLKKDVDRLGYSGAGRKYGVSDNSVRKWLKLYEKRTGSRLCLSYGK